MGDLDDGALARAAATGDRIAFAEIYDRYADRLHDFCVGMLRDREAAADCVQDVFVTAATKLVQLREPDRLRSWLYAIARSEALARIRARKREQLSEELPDMPSGEADLPTMAARTELADLIRQASGGLSDRDQVVLELAYRQGLDGPELADALGVTPKNANTMVERLRDTIARSLGALLVCRGAKADPDRCPELAAILDKWDGQFTVLMRKRVARHIDGCAVCEDERARMVTPAALLGATPVVIPAPGWLRGRTLDRAVLDVRGGGSGPTGPEDDESWWPPSDFDDVADTAGDADEAADAPQERSPAHTRGGLARIGLGTALVLIGVGGATVLAPSSALRVVPAQDSGPLTTTSTTPPVTTTTDATTPGNVQRTAPSSSPAAIPPPATTTTTAVVIAPTTETTEAPVATTDPATTEEQTSSTPPSTTEPRTTTKRTQTTEQQPEPQPVTEEPPVQEPSTPQPTPSTPKTRPPITISKVPTQVLEPNCDPMDPQCNGGGSGGPFL